MNCFRHSDVPAVGLCKACSKGVCPDCAAEASGGLACRGSCEVRVSETEEMTQRAKAIYGIGGAGPSGVNTGVLLWSLLAGSSWMAFFYFYLVRGRFFGAMFVISVIMTLGLAITYRGYRRARLNC